MTGQDVGLFGGDDRTGFLRGLQNQLGVERLDGVHIDDAGGDALGGQLFGGGQRHLHVHADRDDA